MRVLDGNHLTGTEHRLEDLRTTRAAALPGKALVFYEPCRDLITDVVPCEDAYTQERALVDQALALVAAKRLCGRRSISARANSSLASQRPERFSSFASMARICPGRRLASLAMREKTTRAACCRSKPSW